MAHDGKTTNSSGWNAVFSWIKYALTGKRDETKAVSQSSVSASSLVSIDARLKAIEKLLSSDFGGDDAKLYAYKSLQSAKTFSPDRTETLSALSQNENGEMSATFSEVQANVSTQTDYTSPGSTKTNLSTMFGKIWYFIGRLRTSIRSSNSASDTEFPSEKAVRDAINAAISAVYKAGGTKTVADLTSSLLVAANEGFVYNITDSGTTTADFIEGAGKPIRAGDNVGICAVTSGGTTTYKFDLLSGFVDLSNYVQKSSTAGLLKNDGSVDTNSYLTTSASHPQIGSQTIPVWVDSNGNVQECSNPSGWSVGAAGYADLARYIYSTEFGGCDKPTFIKATGQTNVAELGSAFDIPHFVTRWHEELYYPSKTGFGIIHRTDKFSDPTTKPLSLSIEISTNNSSFDITLDGSSLTPWYGGQVWGTIKWDSQSGSNLNSAISRIGISNIADSSTILATRNISTSNQQDIQGHALFAICTGDFLHRYVVDMEISLIKPQAGSSVSYVSVVSKCHSVSPVV